jgi:hypothetical protein
MDFREVVDGAKGGFEELVGKIPGYKGYKEKELRRQADKLLRGQVADELDVQRRRLSEQQMELIHAGLIEYTDDLDRAVVKLQTLVDRIRTASYGYRSFFDAVKVKEEQLDALYAFDTELLAGVPELAAGIDAVTEAIESGEGIPATIKALIKTTAQMNEQFSKRQDAIYQVGQEEL